MTNQKIIVDGLEVSIKSVSNEDFISLTDMAKKFSDRPDLPIRNWLKNTDTIKFLELWEKLNNPNFNPAHLGGFKEQAGSNSFYPSVKQWIGLVNAIGIESKRGRYGGTYAHIDIAFEFASWLSPEFKLYLITEFKRLKSEEAKRLNYEFDEIRFLSKVNYTLQTKAIEENILPRLSKVDKPFAYSNEADLLNQVVFGMTAKQWRENNPHLKGNIRDNASILELNILNNLQSRNAELIDNGVEAELRFKVLLQMAQKQFQRLADDPRVTSSDEIDKLN